MWRTLTLLPLLVVTLTSVVRGEETGTRPPPEEAPRGYPEKRPPEEAPGGFPEKRLIRTLLDNYERMGKMGRPVQNASEPVHVDISFRLIQILDIDQEKQIMSLVGWLAMEWHDPLLSWDQETFNDIDLVILPLEKIWVPEVELFNAIEPTKTITNGLPVVRSSGDVTWESLHVYKFLCETVEDEEEDIRCRMLFTTVAYTSSQVAMSHKRHHMEFSDYHENNKWEVYSTRIESKEYFYSCCPDQPYMDISMTLTLKKRPEEEEEEEEEEDTSSANKLRISFLPMLALLLSKIF